MRKFALFAAFILLTSGFALAQTGGLKGKVRSDEGDSIPGAIITIRQDGDDLKSAKSDNKGNFSMDGVKPGRYNIVFRKAGYTSGLMYNVEVVGKKTRDLGDRLILKLDDGFLVIINGSAYDQRGFAIYGAKVKIEKILADGSTKKLDTGYTSRTGEFTFRYSDEVAKFRVTVSAKGVEASKDVEVEEAATYRVAITLELK